MAPKRRGKATRSSHNETSTLERRPSVLQRLGFYFGWGESGPNQSDDLQYELPPLPSRQDSATWGSIRTPGLADPDSSIVGLQDARTRKQDASSKRLEQQDRRLNDHLKQSLRRSPRNHRRLPKVQKDRSGKSEKLRRSTDRPLESYRRKSNEQGWDDESGNGSSITPNLTSGLHPSTRRMTELSSPEHGTGDNGRSEAKTGSRNVLTSQSPGLTLDPSNPAYTPLGLRYGARKSRASISPFKPYIPYKTNSKPQRQASASDYYGIYRDVTAHGAAPRLSNQHPPIERPSGSMSSSKLSSWGSKVPAVGTPRSAYEAAASGNQRLRSSQEWWSPILPVSDPLQELDIDGPFSRYSRPRARSRRLSRRSKRRSSGIKADQSINQPLGGHSPNIHTGSVVERAPSEGALVIEDAASVLESLVSLANQPGYEDYIYRIATYLPVDALRLLKREFTAALRVFYLDEAI